MLDLLTGLRKIRENIPRKLTVTDVIKERRELVRIYDVTPSFSLTIFADVLRLPRPLCMSTRIQST